MLYVSVCQRAAKLQVMKVFEATYLWFYVVSCCSLVVSCSILNILIWYLPDFCSMYCGALKHNVYSWEVRSFGQMNHFQNQLTLDCFSSGTDTLVFHLEKHQSKSSFTGTLSINMVYKTGDILIFFEESCSHKIDLQYKFVNNLQLFKL